jgi:hypothetical protein
MARRKSRTIKKKKGGSRAKVHHNKSNKIKSMNCHPVTKGQTPVKGSCFTVETLNKIKVAYNKHHKDNVITINDPHLLWLELKNRFNTCDKEDCWLEHLDDDDLKHEIEEMSFAPDHPPEWKKNPDEWLSNYDILEVLEQYEEKHKEFKFIGPSPIDFDTRPKEDKCVWEELCTFSLDKLDPSVKKIGVVFNLDKHNEPGSHWVSLFIDLEDHFMFYLDSAGDNIPPEVDALVKRIQGQWNKKHQHLKMRVYKNHPFEHQKGNTECGMYSLFFIITLLTKQIEGKSHTTSELIKLFRSKRIPDKYVFNYRKIYFNS